MSKNYRPWVPIAVHPNTVFLDVILRSPASGTTKNLTFGESVEILRGACPEPVEGLRMTLHSFLMDTNESHRNLLRGKGSTKIEKQSLQQSGIADGELGKIKDIHHL